MAEANVAPEIRQATLSDLVRVLEQLGFKLNAAACNMPIDEYYHPEWRVRVRIGDDPHDAAAWTQDVEKFLAPKFISVEQFRAMLATARG